MSGETGGGPAILVFLKEPVPGRVKTRLAAEVGGKEAARIYRHLCERVIDGLPRAAAIRVCYDPPGAEGAIRDWLGPFLPEDATFHPQDSGDLGKRLAGAFGAAFAEGYGPVVAVGTDCPTLGAGDFLEAWGKLGGADAVLGPAEDGGYYLIGLKRHEPALFEGIGWSGPEVLAQTVAAAERCGLRVGLLGVRSDIDTVFDWTRYAATRGEGAKDSFL